MFAAWEAHDAEGLEGDELEAAHEGLPEDPFWALCARVARRLHEDVTIERTFGRPVPVILHDLEYGDEVLALNRRANPPELLAGFERFWADEA